MRMRTPYHGCDRDCFRCPYPDCYQPQNLCCLPDDTWKDVWERIKEREQRKKENARKNTRTRINKRRVQNG